MPEPDGTLSRSCVEKMEMATEQEKTEELEALLRFGKPIGVSTVLLVNSSGDQMGSASII